LRHTRLAAGLVSLATLIALATVTTSPVVATRRDGEKQKAQPDNQAWKDSKVDGVVLSTYWAEAKQKGQWTAVIVVWSNASDIAVTVYGDDPVVRSAIVDGSACVGRYVVVAGDRLEATDLVGRGIQVPSTDTECTAVIAPQPPT